jgi:hypothetical protein
MQESNYNSSVCYSYTDVSSQNRSYSKKYFINNKTLVEKNHITKFPVEYNKGYVFSINFFGNKIAHQNNIGTNIFYKNTTDDLVFTTYKNNSNSSNYYKDFFPVLFNNTLSYFDLSSKKIKSGLYCSSSFIKSICVKDTLIFVFNDYFVITNTNMNSFYKFSTKNKIKNLEVGNTKDNLSVLLTDEQKTVYIEIDYTSFKVIKKLFYNFSGDTTITSSNFIFGKDENSIYDFNGYRYSSETPLPTKLFTNNKNLILVGSDKKFKCDCNTLPLSRVIKDSGYILQREKYDIESYEKYDLNREYISHQPSLIQLREMKIDNALSF